MEIKTKYNIGDKIYMISFDPRPQINIDYIVRIDVNVYELNKEEIKYASKFGSADFYEKEINKATGLNRYHTCISDNKERALEILKMYLENQYKEIEKGLKEEEREDDE